MFRLVDICSNLLGGALDGTWGTGSFDNDIAGDFLDQLEDLPALQRLAVIESTFRVLIESGESSASSVLSEEIIAAAALVAANLPEGQSFAWDEEYPGMSEWLPKPIPSSLASNALQALELAVPPGGRFWRSWVDDRDRAEAQAVIESLRSVLLGTSRGESK